MISRGVCRSCSLTSWWSTPRRPILPEKREFWFKFPDGGGLQNDVIAQKFDANVPCADGNNGLRLAELRAGSEHCGRTTARAIFCGQPPRVVTLDWKPKQSN